MDSPERVLPHRMDVVHALDGGGTRTDAVVVEEPLEVAVAGPRDDGEVLAVTMRTPGDDLALATGLCWSEGLLGESSDLLDASHCRAAPRTGRTPDADAQRVLVRLRRTPDLASLRRHGVMTSACGVCGRTTVDDLARRVPDRAPAGDLHVDAAVLATMPQRLREAQRVFGATGGLHAVARFDEAGNLLDVAEDVGRHNAFDKVVGRAVRHGDVHWSRDVVLLSGRASYELLAKAAMVGVPVVAAIGAPSSLAIDVAERFGITLVGFLRGGSGNVHTHPQRVLSAATSRGGTR